MRHVINLIWREAGFFPRLRLKGCLIYWVSWTDEEINLSVVPVFTWTLTYNVCRYEIASFSAEAAYGGGHWHVRLTFIFCVTYGLPLLGPSPKLSRMVVPALFFLLIFDSCVIQLGLTESLLLDAWNIKECTKYFLITFLTWLVELTRYSSCFSGTIGKTSKYLLPTYQDLNPAPKCNINELGMQYLKVKFYLKLLPQVSPFLKAHYIKVR